MFAIISVAFLALIGVMVVNEPANEKQKQQYAIDCVNAGGKMEFTFGSGMVCTTK
jgi:hypothetical protein